MKHTVTKARKQTIKGGEYSMKIPNIKYTGGRSHFVENASSSIDSISFYKDREYFSDIVTCNNFVKACEREIRRSQEYSDFVSYIKREIGLDFCQVTSNIYDSDAPNIIEMHHNVFTLFDYTLVVLNSFIEQGRKITTFRIADQVIQEHYDMRVQVVMVSVTNHEAIHNRDLFINLKQGFGNINAFIEKYKDYLTDDLKYRLWNYINICKSNDSFDNGVLDIPKIEKLISIE